MCLIYSAQAKNCKDINLIHKRNSMSQFTIYRVYYNESKRWNIKIRNEEKNI